MSAYEPSQVEQLENLGWGRDDAKVYCVLVKMGELRAKTIKSELNMGKTKVYEHLNSLVNNNRAEITEENPRKYAAVDPESLLNNEIEKFKSSAEEVKGKLAQAMELQDEFYDEESSTVSIIKNSEGLNVKLMELIEKAEKSVKGFDCRKPVLSKEVVELLNKRAEDIEIEIIARKDREIDLEDLETDKISAQLLSEGFLEKSTFYVIDEKYIMLSLERGRKSISLEDQYFGKLMQDRFDNVLKDSAEEVVFNES